MVGTGDTDMALTLMEGKSSHQETHESKSVKLGRTEDVVVVVVWLLSCVQLLRPNELQPAKLLCPWDFPDKNTGMAALFIIARTWKQPRCPSADEWIRKLWYIYTMDYYSAIKKNSFESVLMRWMKLEPIIQSEVSQKNKHQYSILTHISVIQKDGNDNPKSKTEKETQMYRADFWTLWEKARVG